ncbi:extracellular solute-binding protein [Phytoactinopolyspora limicola]|uniref:extracellular solute-binding protein n=1 Tax=Phytoactinopolyspora limicola TaxID=2715536 RepID=UPI00140B4DCF|nr:extracellular solute-binding protein [Phytoactinopolyspora limicola]
MTRPHLWGTTALVASAALTLTACGGSGDDGGIGTINFYSPETADMTEEIAAAFEDQVGGKVTVTSGGTNEIVNQMLAEQDNPRGDVWYGGGGFMPFEFAKENGLLEAYTPDVVADLDLFDGPIQMRDDEWYWIGADIFVLGLAYNTELVSEDELPETWAELADERWRDEIQLPNPAASGTATLFVLSQVMLQGEDAAWEYFDRVVENASAIPDSGAGPTQAVAQGEASLGVAFEFMPYQLQEQQGAPVEFHVPADTPVLVNPITLIADGPNPEGGQRFIEWFLSPEGQQIRADWHYLVANDEVDMRIPLSVADVIDHAMDLDIDWVSDNYDATRQQWADRYGS